MNIHDFVASSSDSCPIDISAVLADFCSDFLSLNSGPLYKTFPTPLGQSFKRVKVRQKKSHKFIDPIIETGVQIPNLSAKQVVVSPTTQTITPSTYYVFPINGFKFLYASRPLKALEDAFDKLIDLNVDNSYEIAVNLVRTNFKSDSLATAMLADDIILYNMPFYFVAHTLSFPNYKQLIIES